MMQNGDPTTVETFEQMFLGLGPDVTRLDSSVHDQALLTAKASVVGRWTRLLQLEGQIEREAAILAARPKERGYVPGDEYIADSLVARQAEAWKAQTDEMASSLEYLRAEAAKERAILTSFVVKNGVRGEER